MANTEMWKSILCTLLECGYLDLDILNDADEDFVLEAIENLESERMEINLGTIVSEMFLIAIADIAFAIEHRIEDLKGYEADGVIDDDEREELEALKGLDTDIDIEWYFNYLDTGIYFTGSRNKGDVYRKYFGDLIEELENKMGFEFV